MAPSRAQMASPTPQKRRLGRCSGRFVTLSARFVNHAAQGDFYGVDVNRLCSCELSQGIYPRFLTIQSPRYYTSKQSPKLAKSLYL